jgi:ABC-type uncharacterized transport system substrate-binding protein
MDEYPLQLDTNFKRIFDSELSKISKEKTVIIHSDKKFDNIESEFIFLDSRKLSDIKLQKKIYSLLVHVFARPNLESMFQKSLTESDQLRIEKKYTNFNFHWITDELLLEFKGPVSEELSLTNLFDELKIEDK